MTRIPLRRLLLGFGAGAAAGWAAGLLRTPRTTAVGLPQRDFGDPPGADLSPVAEPPAEVEPAEVEPAAAPADARDLDPVPTLDADPIPPAAATAPDTPLPTGGETPDVAADVPAEPAAKPKRARAGRPRMPATIDTAATEALREGLDAAAEHLDEPVPPAPPAPGPAARRRRKSTEG